MGRGERYHGEKRRRVHRPAGRKTFGRGFLASVAGREKDQGQTKLRQVIGGCLARACHAAMGGA